MLQNWFNFMMACFAICMFRYNCQYFAIGWVCSSNDRVPCGHSLFPFLLQSSLGSHRRRNAHALKRARTHTTVVDFDDSYTSLSFSKRGERAAFLPISLALAAQTRGLREEEKRTGFPSDGTKYFVGRFCKRCYDF